MTDAPSGSAPSGSAESLLVVHGVVVPGDQRGRLLGFPTANVPLDASWVTDGVYAGTVVDEADGSEHVAAVSIGRRTSFYGRDGERLLEAHLLDFAGDLYGHTIRVELRAKLRPQRRYRGAEALIEQLERDIVATRTWAREQADAPVRQGRRAPVRSRRAVAADDAERLRREREERRIAAIAQTVGDLGHEGVTHEIVAERSRIPVAYLRWAYPTTGDLVAAARRPGAAS